MRQGDNLVVPKLDLLARSVPNPRTIAALLRERGVKLALGRTLYEPGDAMGKVFLNILATLPSSRPISSACAPAKVWRSPAPGGNCAASSPNCPIDSRGNFAA